jgi:plasmid maintenance system antidote protein VapI
MRLGRYFGNRPQFWLDLQGQYEIAWSSATAAPRSPGAPAQLTLPEKGIEKLRCQRERNKTATKRMSREKKDMKKKIGSKKDKSAAPHHLSEKLGS